MQLPVENYLRVPHLNSFHQCTWIQHWTSWKGRQHMKLSTLEAFLLCNGGFLLVERLPKSVLLEIYSLLVWLLLVIEKQVSRHFHPTNGFYAVSLNFSKVIWDLLILMVSQSYLCMMARCQQVHLAFDFYHWPHIRIGRSALLSNLQCNSKSDSANHRRFSATLMPRLWVAMFQVQNTKFYLKWAFQLSCP